MTDRAGVGIAGPEPVAQPDSASRRRGFPPPVLRHRGFALLFFSLLFSNTGTWMAQTVQAWLVYELTGSALALGTVFGAFAIPMIVLPFFGGVLADRLDRRKVIWIMQSAATLLALTMAILVATELIQVWHIFVISFISAIALAFDQPTRQAIIPDLVPRDELRPAVALNSAVFTGGAFIGPALAGFLVAQAGLPLAGAFFINAATFGAVIVAVAFMRIPPLDPSRTRGSVLRTALDGFRFVGRNELIIMVMILSLATSLFGRSYHALLPVFAKDILDVGIQGLGMMNSAPGAGSIVGAVLIGMNIRLPPNGVLSLGGTVVMALLVIGFASSESYVLSLVLLFLLGVLGTVLITATRTILQLRAPREYMGRVMSLSTIAVIGFGPLGGFIVGPLAEFTGAPYSLYLSSALVVIAAAFLAGVRPTLRQAT
ncbi:MAG: MFS transporter [Chloroflexi bacterium]|nr:MFS transporter [Chloroflexota bacterium]MCY3939441.1 MFS transporter [Chloroflexota bacterium]